MSELDDLYQEQIIYHSRNPRNQHAMDDATGRAKGFNPLCGDDVTVYLKTEGGSVQSASFESKACAICTASASLMTQAIQNRSVEEAKTMAHHFVLMARGEAVLPDEDAYRKLLALSGVSRFASRVKCATLPWHALEAALADDAKEGKGGKGGEGLAGG